MSPQDVALIQRWIKSKDPDAFTEIVNRYSGLIYGASLRVLRNQSDAEDVAQECFMRIVEAPTNVESSLGGWLHTVATRRALTRLRGEKRRATREGTFAKGQSVAAEAVWDDLQPMIDDVIAGLPERFRAPVVEHYLLGRTLESIGKDLGVSRQAVHRRLKKGVEEIRSRLRDKGLPITGAALTTGFAEIAMAAPSEGLRKGLFSAAVAGIDGDTAVEVTSKAAVSWIAAPIIATAIVALVVLGVQVSKSTNDAVAPSPPPAPVNVTAPPVLVDDDLFEAAVFAIAQADADEVSSGDADKESVDSGTPDFTEFSLERPFPKPGVGSLYYYLSTPDSVGADLTITLVNWKPWEQVPQTRLTYTQTVPRSRIVFFKNLPLGTYYASVVGETTGTNWFSTLTESMAGEHVVFPLWPKDSIEVSVTNEAGTPLSGARVLPYQSKAFGGIFPFPIVAGIQRQISVEGSVILPDVVRGTYKGMIRAPGYALTPSGWKYSEDDSPISVVLTEGGSFECRVVDEWGNPVEGAYVQLQGDYYHDHGHALTDSDGLAYVMFLRPVDYKVRVYSEEYVLSGSPVTVTIEEGGLSSIGNVEVRPGVELVGRVYDTKTELGIPGIRLSVDADIGVTIEDITTDDDGFYTIPNASLTRYRISRHDSGGYGYGAGTSRIDVTVTADGIEGDSDFALTRGIPVSGRVVDTDGRPVMGAIIRAGYGNTLGDLRQDALSDRRGRFNLSSIDKPGEIYIRAQAAGYGRKISGPFEISEEGLGDIELVLPHAAIITGRIKIDGQYAPYQTYLWSRPQDPDSEEGRTGTGLTYILSGPDEGLFILPWLTPGTYNLSVQPPGGSQGPTVATVTVEEGELIDNFNIEHSTSGLSLTGSVVDRSGAPVEFASILARDDRGSSVQAQSNIEGVFSFKGLLDSYYTVEARHREHSTVVLENVIARQGSLRITMPDHGSVVGSVVGVADGAAVQRFQVARVAGLLDAPPLRLPSGLTIASDTGSFELKDVEIGDSTLIFSGEGFSPAIVHAPDVRENRTTDVGTVRLGPATLLTGLIRSADGEPVSGASIHYGGAYYVQLGSVSSQNSYARSDSNGRYAIDTFPEGEFELSVSHRDYASSQIRVQLVPGRTTEVDVTLYGGGALEGIIYAGGVPYAGGIVLLTNSDGSVGMHQAQTDANGRYELTRVPAGEYLIRAYVPSIEGERSVSDEYLVVVENFGTQILDWTF